MSPDRLIELISILAVPIILAITLHEVAHGWAAKQFGDLTAFREGRLSLNPLRHVDPVGTIIVPLAMAAATQGQMYFGWAKPVPVDPRNLRNPRRDMAFVAAAGPGANLAMATCWTLLYVVFVTAGLDPAGWAVRACQAGIYFNVLLMVFNFIPIPPLDGSKVLAAFLPPRGAEVINRMGAFGFIIVILLMLPPLAVLWTVMEPLMRVFLDFYYSIIRDLT